ncbi:MAG TPA: SDR family oxidoreductase [Thermoanaerobaculia bacterium]|nr:SDR family oxidoreductase [Thermoanaerobaculia bacterium]
MTTAIITGASQGLGRAIAELLAQRNFHLVLNARRREPLEALARELGAVAVPGDVTEVAEEIAAAAGDDVSILINNASELGPLPMPRLEEYPWQELMRVLKVNVAAPVHLAQLVLPRMKARGSGLIINIISDAGINAYPGWGGYGMSKAALEHASRTFAAELEGTGVRVVAVDPGDMDTEMHRLAIPDADVSQLARPEDVAPRIAGLI